MTSTRFIHAGSLMANDTVYCFIDRTGGPLGDYPQSHSIGHQVASVEQLSDQDTVDVMNDAVLVIPVTITLACGIAFTVISGQVGAEVLDAYPASPHDFD